MTNDVFNEENKHYVSIFLKAQYPKGQPIQNLEPNKLIAWEWVDINFLPETLFLPLKNLILEKGDGFLLALSEII